jgi:hypothetical protein
MPRQGSRTDARRARRFALVVLLGGSGLGFSHSASAGTSLDCPIPSMQRHSALIRGGRVDFGEEPHLFGEPRTPGLVCFKGSATVKGKLYWDSFDAGCAHITLRYFNSSSPSQQLRNESFFVCSSGGLRWAQLIEPIVGLGTAPANRVRSVQIQLFTSATATSTKSFQAEKSFNF